MLYLLYNSAEFQNVPLKDRKNAAWEAQQRAMHHWRFLGAIALMPVATVLCSIISRKWLWDDDSGTIGALCGFILGMLCYGRALKRIGMPYYRQILSNFGKDDEHPTPKA